MRKAEELLKESTKTGANIISMEWKVQDTKHRRILVDNSLAFLQTEYDVIGIFSSPYTDLSID